MNLPDDALCEIAKWLSPEELTMLRLTCKRFYKIARIEDMWLNEVYWVYISHCKKLSEKFIEKYADYVDWEYISCFQTLSESFIEKYADKVDWMCIHLNQDLSEAFIEKYAERVNLI